MTLIEKVAYIKGMIEMADLEESKENKLIKAIVDVLDDMALSIEDLEDGAAELTEQIDAVDEDLANLEEDFYEDEDDCCEDDEDDDFYEMECPACHDIIYIDEGMLDEGGIQCPNCGTDLEFDFECDCEDCDHDEAEAEGDAK
ncbi:MAG: CD1247 N-terminal domain-containing protein [Candidatus Howiella sp.]|jgi:hypothetical protein